MARTATSKGRNRTNRLGYVLLIIMVLLLTVLVYAQSRDVKAKIAVYEAQENELDEKIAAQQSRAAEIEEYEKYVQTKAYAEQQAQEKLGLVNEGEIIFKREK